MLIGKSKILNQILVKMLKFSIVPEYKGKPVETVEHFLHRRLDNTKSKTRWSIIIGMSPSSACVTDRYMVC